MNYRLQYDKLIAAAKARTSSPEYGETHHIVPKSEGGNNDKTNLVKLSYREHYIAHLLLAKIYDDFKMLSALIMMRKMTHQMERHFKFNSRLFEKMRLKWHKSILGHTSPMKGKTFSLEVRSKMSIGRKGIAPWNKGRPLSDEAKRKISESVSISNFGCYYWNDGIRCVKSRECPGPEWRRGRFPNKNGNIHTTLGMKWWNDGIHNKMTRECPGIGWKPGKIQKKPGRK